MLTCRTRAFDDALRACLDWQVETLAPFTLGQIRHFVPAWYAELVAVGQLTAAQAERLSEELVATIAGNQRLCDMAATPLLLTMMALLLFRRGTLPRDRPRLYEEILELLLGQWDKVRDGQSLAEVIGRPDWTSERLRPLLDRLSYEAHLAGSSLDGRGRLERSRVRDALIDFFETAQVPEPWGAARRCLDYFEQRASKVPQLSDLRDSGSLEQDADIVIFIYRDEPDGANGQGAGTELHLAKQRNGPLGVIPVQFDAPTTRFCTLP